MKNNFSGAFLVDKPAGISSFDVIRTFKQALIKGQWFKTAREISIGHTGTLDPFATGLMVVCLAESLALVRYLLHAPKTYSGEIRFGEKTATGDPTSEVTERRDLPMNLEAIRQQARQFKEYWQLPPMTSALKQGGQRLYALAREGKEVPRDRRRVEINDFEILSYTPPHATFRVQVSGGTYVRVLAEDLAERLSSVGHLRSLRREAIGEHFKLTQARPLSEWQRILTEGHCPKEGFLSQDRLVPHLPSIEVEIKTLQSLYRGQQELAGQIGNSIFPRPVEEQRLALFHDGRLSGILVATQGKWRIERMIGYRSSSGS